MKKFSVLVLVAIATVTGCKKEEEKIFGCTDPDAVNYNYLANTDNGTCDYEGDVMFWYNSNGTNAEVNISGYTRYITMYYSAYDPSCGATGCANFTLPIGTYSYHAESTFSTWDGFVTVTTNGCSRILLY